MPRIKTSLNSMLENEPEQIIEQAPKQEEQPIIAERTNNYVDSINADIKHHSEMVNKAKNTNVSYKKLLPPRRNLDNKIRVGFYIKRSAFAKIQRAAKNRGYSNNEIIEFLVDSLDIGE